MFFGYDFCEEKFFWVETPLKTDGVFWADPSGLSSVRKQRKGKNEHKRHQHQDQL